MPSAPSATVSGHKQGQFVGIDLGERPIAQRKATIEALGLRCIRDRCRTDSGRIPLMEVEKKRNKLASLRLVGSNRSRNNAIASKVICAPGDRMV